uniref:RNase H type-1 domain-containing protein n=1 Tax=Oryza nivara TaxID=4536 RepID=A0A0E0HR20_ORYNI
MIRSARVPSSAQLNPGLAAIEARRALHQSAMIVIGGAGLFVFQHLIATQSPATAAVMAGESSTDDAAAAYTLGIEPGPVHVADAVTGDRGADEEQSPGIVEMMQSPGNLGSWITGNPMDCTADYSRDRLLGGFAIDTNETENLVRSVREVCDLLTGDREILVRKVHRCVNSVSHSLANKARYEACSKIWLENN